MVTHAIALHSIIPMRAEAAESSEMLTQMLFGETCTILEELPRWKRVRSDLDGQEGWVDFKMITTMSAREYRTYHKQWRDTPARVLFPMVYAVSGNNQQTIPLTLGTRLPNYTEDGTFSVLGVQFRIDPNMVAPCPAILNEDNLLHVTRFLLNTPYLWAGKSALGMDCSGLTQVVHTLFGHELLRNAREQITQGRPIKSLNRAKAGDLVFFDHHDGYVSHVGILIDSERVMHCSGRVKVECIDEEGIFSIEMADGEHPDGQYTHHLIGIRRYGK